MIPWSLILLLMSMLSVHSQLDSNGFLSIDCGLPANSTYVDEETNLTFISDVQFINSGVVGRINSNSKSKKLSKEFQIVRYFPKGKTNCYTLAGLKVGFKYLIRALFYYGNYDNLNKPPSFDIYFGLYSDTVNASSSDLLHPEMIFMATTDNLQVCLDDVGYGVPFISSIHLRQLNSGIYPLVNFTYYSLHLEVRYNIGENNCPLVRYPDDMYDRWWLNYTQESWTKISTNNIVVPNASFQTPSFVMQTAATTSSAKEPIAIKFTPYRFSSDYIFFLYFMEIKNTSMSDRREFTISLNADQKLIEHIPGWLIPGVQSFLVNWGGYWPSNYICSLEATANSTLPPLLNAIEIYGLDNRMVPTDRQNVDAVNNIKEHYKIARWIKYMSILDPCLVSLKDISCSYGSYSGSMKNTVVTKLNLTSSGLTGVLIDSFGNLTSLVSLDLSSNNLSGFLPDSLDKLTALQFLDITGNSMLHTTLPPKLQQKYERKNIYYRFDNINSTSTNASSKTVMTITIAVLVPLLVIVVVVVIATVLRLKRKYDGNYAEQNWQVGAKQSFPKFESRKFSYNDLKKITNNFDNKIGTGGFGNVFLGILEDGVEVAVKMHSHLSAQGVKEVLAEAESLTRVHHKYLVALIGYCIGQKCMALVYEYMEEGNLYDKLKDNKNPISWRQRLQIAYESALGLEYLHKACNPPVIHRDVKTSNILLTASLQPKIADFGLSRAFNNTAISHVSTRVVGTPGYLDPEYYQSTGQLTIKSDVFSFGVVLLEIITGQPPIMVDQEGSNLVQWVHQKLSGGDIESIVDSRLQGEYDIKSVWKVVNLACKCTELKTSERPTMTEVAAGLKESLDLEMSIEEMDCKSTDNLINDVSQDSTFEMAYLSGMSLPRSGEREFFAAHNASI